MAKIDHEKFADRILIAVGKKPKPDADEREPEGDDEADEPGKLGRMLISAIKHGDGEAVEEAFHRLSANCRD